MLIENESNFDSNWIQIWWNVDTILIHFWCFWRNFDACLMQFWDSLKTASFLMQFWCSFIRLLMQFLLCSFKTAPKIQQKFIKTAPKFHQIFITEKPPVYSMRLKSTSEFHVLAKQPDAWMHSLFSSMGLSKETLCGWCSKSKVVSVTPYSILWVHPSLPGMNLN